MASPRYSIGIDLGTTNSALAYQALSGDVTPDILPVPQWDSLTTLAEAATLPSFLYLPEPSVAEQLGGGGWVAGRLARAKAGETPGRVVHSAKSWLCHHAADRSAPFLPWGSNDLAPEQKISPVRASALILNHLRGAWNDRFPDDAFDDQEITVTVPASFDAAAQQLTLTAAAEAGFPDRVRLLEEPQAAFMCWLEAHDAARALWPESGEHTSRHVLVVDIGGGTSDFSLFELRQTPHGTLPAISRVAVSEHILLGGDNIDLALAHFLEPRFTGGGQVAGTQWNQLVALSRDLKERALAGAGEAGAGEAGAGEAAADERFTLALAGRGAGLFAGAQTLQVTRAEIEALLLDGFFPACDARARPHRRQAGLREWGLAYAADSAVTHHLADFLRDRPRIDAMLFNGGSMHPPLLRQRLRSLIGSWQDGAEPLVLHNAEPELAVARGAARHGALQHRRAEQIEAGAARAVFLEVQGAASDAAAPVSLVCVLPRGAAPGETFEISEPALELRVDQPVRFQAFSSTRHRRSRAGDVLAWREDRFHPLPPLQTIVQTTETSPAGSVPAGSVPVHLVARINALGLLQISCVSADPARPQAWPLEFNLRPQEQSRAPSPAATVEAAPIEPNAAAEALAAARQRLTVIFTRPASKADKVTASAIFKALEQLLGVPRSPLPRTQWNAPLLRALWPALDARLDGRRLSVDHEEAWLTLAGFLLRPGFGLPDDARRIDSLWRLHETGACFPGRRIKCQEYILWRRLAGGLTAERQISLLAGDIERLRAGKAPPELVRMAGAFERVPRETKANLARHFIDIAGTLARADQHCAPYLAALGLLLNRAPLYGGPETIVPPDLVEAAYDRFRGLDWAAADFMELQTLFLRAARVVNDRSLDVPQSLRGQIAARLEKAGVAPLRTAKIVGFMPIGRSDRAGLLDESLPPGLMLGGG